MRMICGKAELAVDTQVERRTLHAAPIVRGVGVDFGYSVEILQKILVPHCAAKFAVGDAVKTDGLLLVDDARDLAVLDRLQLRAGNLAVGKLRLGVLERRRTQQAADMIRPERRLCSFHRPPKARILGLDCDISPIRPRFSRIRNRPACCRFRFSAARSSRRTFPVRSAASSGFR